jgi:Na+-transporting methylmalonyl-CoA/oxaloacetate decarboxylase gamma subunit
VSVRVVLSGSGYLVCATYLNNSSSPSSSEMLLLEGVPIAGVPFPSSSPSPYPDDSTSATYPLTSLFPSSQYNIYCTALSPTLVPMSTEDMLLSKVSAKTTCCRLLSVTLKELVVDDVSVLGIALTLDLGSAKVGELLKVSISGVELGSLVVREMFVPSHLTFVSTSSSKTDLTYVPVMPGSYRLNVTLSGSSKDDYKVVFPRGDILVVKAVEEELPPPMIQRSEFTSDGSKLTVIFASATNRGGVVNVINCGTLFKSTSSLSRCVWTSDSSLEISLIGSKINSGNVLEVKSGVWKARCTSKVDPTCSNWRSNDFQNSTISVPSVVKTPLVTMSMASTIGPCDDLVVDLTSSSGSGGRSWRSVSFLVGGLGPNITLVQEYLSTLSANPSSVRSPVAIPNTVLRSGYAYSLAVRLCNFLGACGSKVKTFSVSSPKSVPVVSLNSRDTLSIFRNTSLLISGSAYVTVCGGGKSREYLSYNWSLFENNAIMSSKELQSVSVNPQEFKLPAYRMSVGSLYQLKLVVKHTISMRTSSTSLAIFIKSGDLVCLLPGGNEFGLRVDGSLLLDMSRSYDSDLGPNSQPLLFELQCFQISPSYHDSCPSLIFSPSTSMTSPSAILVTTNTSLAAVNDVFQIVMKGKSSTGNTENDFRSCEKMIQIAILTSISPMLRLEVLSGLKMNPSSTLKILSHIDMGMESTGEVQWSINDESIVLSSVALSPLTRILPPSSSTNSTTHHVFSLVIIGNCFPPQSTFVFTLSCTLGNGQSSSTSVAITTNSPPFGGSLDVSPVVGVMLETVFSMLSLDWVDEDLPLSYEFGYLTPSPFSPSSFSSPANDVTVFRSKSQLTYASTLLPSGLNESSSNLTCVVIAFDQLNSYSREIFADVFVEERILSIDDMEIFLWNGINSSLVTGDPNDLKNTLSSTTTVLNRANCSSAPNCFSLNRMECSTLGGTCGECLSGFIGLMGSSNTPCLSSSEIHRRLQSSSRISVSSSLSNVCHSDSDCLTHGLFLECNLRSNFCQSIQQTCPNSCSGQGRCVFSSIYDLNVTLEECGLLDGNCVPRCECEDGFMGSSCSLLDEDFLKQVDLRHSIVEGVNDLMRRENVEASNVKSWIKTLSSVSRSDYLGLSEETKISMSSLAINILNTSAEVGLSIEDLQESGIDRVLDMCVSGLSSSFTTSGDGGGESDRMSLLMSLLQGYSNFVTSDMLQDQYPVSSINPFLRSSSFHLSSSSPPSSPLTLPQTGLESLEDRTQHSISLPTDIFLPFKISISETLVQSTSSALSSGNVTRRLTANGTESMTQLTLPFFVSLGRSSCYSGGDCVMKVILQHKLGQSRLETASLSPNATEISPYFEADCQIGVVKDHEFLCPSGEEIVISCNGSFSGRGRRYCPMQSFVTVCETDVQYSSTSTSSSTSESLEDLISCSYSPSESTPSMTTCLCDLSSLRLINEDTSVSFSLLSIEKSVVSDFVSTWSQVPSLSSKKVVDSWVVLATIGGVGVIFLLMVLLCVEYDKHQSQLVSSLEIEKKKKEKTKRKFADAQDDDEAHPDELQEKKLIEDALPSIFNSESLWSKFKEEMKVYHRWLGIIFYYSPEFPRAMRVLSLFSSIVTMLFVQSVTYNIADPDDGSCEKCEDDMDCCLSLKSTLNQQENRCYWKSSSSPSSSAEGSCHLRDIGEDDLMRMVIVAMISAIVSAPLALSIQYLIMNVLSKRCVSDEEIEQGKQKIQTSRNQKFRRTAGASLPKLVESCGQNLLEDLNNLLKELSAHYTALVANKEDDQGIEFRGKFDPASSLTPLTSSFRCLGISRGRSN